MDTLTQAVLGATVACLVTGKTAPKKALLWGALIATLPDLDVFIPHDSDLDTFILHRSWSHSWLIQSLLAPFLALLLYKVPNSFSYKSWLLLIWLALITHSGLDALTIYGTQLFWPINQLPISGGSVFIIDPMYTLPLLFGVIAILFWPNNPRSHRWLRNSFLFSCCYLIWGVAAQNVLLQQTKSALLQQNILAENVLVTASPFNSLLWRVLVLDKDYYYEEFHSVFDKAEQFHFTQYNRQQQLQDLLANKEFVQRLDWFTHGFYALKQTEQQIIMSDLRMGLEPYYFFSFVLAERKTQGWNSLKQPLQLKEHQRPIHLLSKIWWRIWDPSVKI